MRQILRFLLDEDGPTLAEYAVMLACIIAVCVMTISAIGGASSAFWDDNSAKLDNAIHQTQGGS